MAEMLAVLTDLAPPERPAGATLPRLPTLERLLARAERGAPAPDWRRWCLARLGLGWPPGEPAIGATLAAAAGLPPAGTWLLATPVHLQASLTDLHAHVAGPLRLPAGAAAALAARFAADLGGDGWRLEAVGEQLLLGSDAVLEVETQDPVTWAGRSVGAGLPAGRDGGRLRRLVTELQMWLHDAPPPSVQGPRVNALWPWGAGRAVVRGARAWPRLETRDPWLAAQRALDADAPESAASLVTWSVAELAIAERAPFERVDTAWFEPLARALASGRVARAELWFGGASFVLRRRQRWRVWSRPRPWWESAA